MPPRKLTPRESYSEIVKAFRDTTHFVDERGVVLDSPTNSSLLDKEDYANNDEEHYHDGRYRH